MKVRLLEKKRAEWRQEERVMGAIEGMEDQPTMYTCVSVPPWNPLFYRIKMCNRTAKSVKN